MARVVFYEKPGCAGNARQRALLRKAGHDVEVRDLLRWPWTAERLMAFLQPLPTAQWFNRASPRIKSGEIDPDAVDRPWALSLLLADPLLIRRPLMECEGRHCVGFDAAAVDAWIGLSADAPRSDLEGCAARSTGATCAGS
ncbi:MAG: hypothetical protein PHP86_15435 [Nevskiales bacterium]|nr:hypothetical protein [Nevskiales bacterium]